MTTLARLAKATGAFATLVVLVAGVPAVLAQIGTSPLRPAPTLADALGDFVSGPLDDHAVLGVITVAAWALWAIFALSIAHEIVLVARGATAGARHYARLLGPFQILAHRLVASILLVGATTAVTGAAPLGARPASATPVVVEATPQSPTGPLDLTTHTTPPPTSPPGPAVADPEAPTMIRVITGDTAWDLAETYLGDGMRWQDLWQHNCTRLQPDGRTWADPQLLLPGWELALPATAAPATTPGTGTTVTVAEGDNAWDLAGTHLGDGMRWQELWTLNQSRPQPDGRVWSDPEALVAGWTFELPATGAPATGELGPPPADAAPTPAAPAPATEAPAVPTPSAPTPTAPFEAEEPSDTAETPPPAAPIPTPAPTGEAPPTPVPDPAAPRPAPDPAPPVTTATTAVPDRAASPEPVARSDSPAPAGNGTEDDTGVPAAPMLGVAGTVLAVALLRSLRRRRARRSAGLPVTVMPPPPPRSSRPAARELLAEADEPAVYRLDAALANLASLLHPRGGEPCVQPQLVQVTGAQIEILLDRPDPAPPAPWRPDASGRIWVLDPDVDVPVTDAARPLPALVTVGVGDSEILVDLEAYGVVSLTGDIDACWALARSMVMEISARAEGTIGIEVVGAGLEAQVADLDGVEVLEGWDGVDAGIIAGSARLLDAGRWPHTFAARASGRVFDGWAPAVWVCTPSDHPRYQATVEEVGQRPGAGSAIVIAGGNEVTHGLRIELTGDGTFYIPALGLTGQAQQLAATTVDQLVDLLDDAEDSALAQTFPFPAPPPRLRTRPGGTTDTHDADEDAGPSGEPAGPGAATPSTGVLAWDRGRYNDPDFEVLVRICGEIHIQGGKHPLPPRESAVAAYITLHREVDLDQIRDAVWGGTDVSRKTVRNVVSSVRRSLGTAVSFVDEGRVRAADTVTTDLDLIRARLAYARHQADPTERAETLHGALDWVQGKVCSYPSHARRSWTWIDLDNWISTVESLVGTVAHDLATLYLELGNATAAAWAARRGIEATGPREQLTLLLVRSYELAGDEPAAASALRSYERHMADLGADEHSEPLLEAMDRYLPPRHGRAAS